MRHILAIDQGTTGTTTILYDETGAPVKRAYRELPQIYPKPGWVEHDPDRIWRTVLETVAELCTGFSGRITALGITNQRETTVLWNRRTGEPLHNAIVWQCRRTADICAGLTEHELLFRRKTGLPLDAYFSGTKIKWLLDKADPPAPAELAFGTVDTWLVWKLTEGRTHATDHTNASRTLLYDIHERAWDPELCGLLNVPPEILPEIRNSSAEYGTVTSVPALAGVPIMGVAGDQQAALFGQACFAPGQVKNTYGTGCFLMMHTGDRRIESNHGLLTTLAVDGDGRPAYALEGSVFVAGAAIQWLRDELGLIESAADSERAALSVPDTGGVYLVPAFVGLGAPHWNMNARGILTGLTRGTTRNHLIRAALEAMAHQTADVLACLENDTGTRIEELAVDGGAAANNFLMQFQADLLDAPVHRPEIIETTSLGAAFLAGLGAGLWKSAAELADLKKIERTFTPAMPAMERERLRTDWQHALRQALV